MANLDALMSSARTGDPDKDEWMTPRWLFDLLNREFKFTLDPAATKENHLCDIYMTKEINGLIQPWSGVTFVNPPYSQLFKWVKKGYEEAERGNATVVMLIPARTDTRAWWDYVRWGDVRFLKGRLKFDIPESEKEKIIFKNTERMKKGKKPMPSDGWSAPFPSAIVTFNQNLGGFRHPPTTFYWDLKTGRSNSSADPIQRQWWVR